MENQITKSSETGLQLTPAPTEPNYLDRIVQASGCEKLMYVNGAKSRFVQLIAKINILLGGDPEKLPQGIAMEVLVNYAMTNWHKYTLEEIEMAVICNIERKNDAFVQFFGTISAQYIADCLHQFDATKRKAILRAKALEQNQVPREIATQDREHFEFIRSWYIEHKSFPMGDYHHAFDYAWKEGLFKDYDLKKWMEDRKDQIIAEICSEKRVGDDIKERNLIEKMFSEESMQLRLRKESLQMLIQDICK
jgi:hypothetical protein